MNQPSGILGDVRFAVRSLSAVGLIASYMPARYASRISPIETLRAE